MKGGLGPPFLRHHVATGRCEFVLSVESSSSAPYAPPSAPSLLGGAPGPLYATRPRDLALPGSYAAATAPFRVARCPTTPMPAKPINISIQVDASGTGVSVKCPTPKTLGFELNSP